MRTPNKFTGMKRVQSMIYYHDTFKRMNAQNRSHKNAKRLMAANAKLNECGISTRPVKVGHDWFAKAKAY